MTSSRDSDQSPPHHHQPLLSSLVVRPSLNDNSPSGGAHSNDYEPGELRREPPPPPYSRSDRFSDDAGYRFRAGSTSPVHRRDADHRFPSDYNHSSRNRGYGGGRDHGRYRDPPPPHFRGRAGGRPIGRAFDGPRYGHGHARGEGHGRNNPNVRPREGDWVCPDPVCGNLNFARRDHCNNCKRPRPAAAGSPRRAYPASPPLHAPHRRFPGPPIDRSPERNVNGYRSPPPPRPLGRDGLREYGSAAALPPLRHEGRFPEPNAHRERIDYMEDAYRGRSKFDRPPPLDWDNRDRGRDGFSNERKGFERRPLSPPAPLLPSLPPHRSGADGGGRWTRDVRERSRSPIRGGPQEKDYRRDTFMNRSGRDDRRGGGVGRDRVGGMY